MSKILLLLCMLGSLSKIYAQVDCPPLQASIAGASEACAESNILYTTQTGMSAYVWTISGTPNVDYFIMEGGASGDNSIKIRWRTNGTYTVTVSYTDPAAPGCAVTAGSTTTSVTGESLFIDYTTRLTCQYSTQTYFVELIADAEYDWFIPGSAGTDYTLNGGTNGNAVTVTWLTAGQRSIDLTYKIASTGCSNVSNALAAVYANPEPTASSNWPVCEGKDLKLFSSPDGLDSYSWEGPDNFSSSVQNPVINGVTTAASGRYTVTVTNSDGCKGTASTVATISPQTVASIDGPASACAEYRVIYTTQPGKILYYWSISGYPGNDYIVLSGGSSSDNFVELRWRTNGFHILTVSYTDFAALACPVTPAMKSTFVTGGISEISSSKSIACVNTDITYSVEPEPDATYDWNISLGLPGTDFTISGGSLQSNSVTIHWITAGIRNVSINSIVLPDCFNEKHMVVEVYDTPSPAASNGGPICAGTDLAFSSSPADMYSYAWEGPGNFSSSAQNPVINGATTAANGTYTVTVTNFRGCTGTASTNAVVAPSLIAGLNAGTINCNGSAATLTATAGGGSGPYSYSLNGTGNYQGSNTFSVPAGTYTVTVKDAYGCTAVSNSKTITQPTAVTATAKAGIIYCNGGITAITVNASGGTGPIKYKLSGGLNFQVYNTFIVGAGTYSVTVNDANGCTKIINGIIISHPPAITESLSAGTINCYGTTTTLTVTAGGGTPGYTYSLNGTTFQSSNKFTVPAGTYCVTVKDSKGCITSKNITIGQPPAINVSAVCATILCYGGTTTVSVSATGGTPGYTGTGTFTKAAGTYTFTVFDSKGCKGSKTITITQPAVPSVSLSSKTNVSCNGGNTGSITVNANGGTTPYTYKVNTASSYQNSPTFGNLRAGSYSVTVKDKNGCTAVLTGISVTQPATALGLSLVQKVNVSCLNGSNGSIKVSAGGGAPPYKYGLNSGSYGPGVTFASLRSGTYTVNAKDANGCTKSISIVINNGTGKCSSSISATDAAITNAEINDGAQLKAAVTPNPAVTEFTLTLSGNSNKPVEIRVVDMYGRSVHYAKGSANQSYKFGQRFSSGVYIVKILQGNLVRDLKIIKGK